MKFGVMRVMGKKLKDTELMSHVAIWTFYLEKQKKDKMATRGHFRYHSFWRESERCYWGGGEVSWQIR